MKKTGVTPTDGDRYTTTTVAANRPTTARTHSSSNVLGVTATAIGDSEMPADATTTRPPWFTASSLAPTARGRGRSTTLNPAQRRRPRTTLSLSCQDSVIHSRSKCLSRQSSTVSSNLFNSDRTFRHPKTTSAGCGQRSADGMFTVHVLTGLCVGRGRIGRWPETTGI